MKTLDEINHDAFSKTENYHQLTLDLIQETEELFNNNDGYCDAALKTHLSALYYHIDTVLEIFNPIFNNDISDLICIQYWIGEKIGL